MKRTPEQDITHPTKVWQRAVSFFYHYLISFSLIILDFLDSLDSFHSLDFLCKQILTEDFKISLTSLSSSLLGYRLFLLSRYRKVKGYRFFITVSHPSVTAGDKGKPSGKRECRLLLTSLHLYFYSEHLESSVTSWAICGTAESHQWNFWNITDCKKIREQSGIAWRINSK